MYFKPKFLEYNFKHSYIVLFRRRNYTKHSFELFFINLCEKIIQLKKGEICWDTIFGNILFCRRHSDKKFIQMLLEKKFLNILLKHFAEHVVYQLEYY